MTIWEWHWSGSDLGNLPKSIWVEVMRFIRQPLLKVLAAGDLIVVGDVYTPTNGPAVLQVSEGRDADILGVITTHDGPAAIVPHGCLPAKTTDRVSKYEITPVSMNGELPGRKDCDSKGRCWLTTKEVEPGWILDNPEKCTGWTHWLPHYAIPYLQ